MPASFGPRRATWIDLDPTTCGQPLAPAELRAFDALDTLYRALVAVLYNFAPQSGHPGGSLSAGRILQALAFDAMAYDLGEPHRSDADVLVLAAGHKALGLYALYALRDEIAAIGDPALLPSELRARLRLEDLLGFRRNPATVLPLQHALNSRTLDGHPTPATPFVPLATGASGVGLAAAVGLAWGLRDRYGPKAPRVHVVEGEGGMTPGRVAEALAAAGTAGIDNLVLHVDWNQASIDSERVCRDDNAPGDYVQWTPLELCYLHDWNVIAVPDGHDAQQVVAAQRQAAEVCNGQPTAVVYRTEKGHGYGITGKKAHGAGHALCSPEFRAVLGDLAVAEPDHLLMACDPKKAPCRKDQTDPIMEACAWQAIAALRTAAQWRFSAMTDRLAARLWQAARRLRDLDRQPRPGGPDQRAIRMLASDPRRWPEAPAAGNRTTLRGELGRVLGVINRQSNGAVVVAAADLLGSTSIAAACEGMPSGWWHSSANPLSRTLATGGICEDAMAGILAGIATAGHHVPAGASYAAFLAPLGHIAARLHAIGQFARHEATGRPHDPMLLVCAHAGLETGEDGPTHADPQALQVLQGNFPPGGLVTLTPWEPAEVGPLLLAALAMRPAVIAPFVTRPDVVVPDRAALGLAPAYDAVQGVYLLHKAAGRALGHVVLQGSGVALAFVHDALPELQRQGVDVDVYYVASVELFDMLPAARRQQIYPESVARTAIGITGFTLATLDRFVTSERGRIASLHPFRGGKYLGSGQGARVLQEAGLDGTAQVRAVMDYLGVAAKDFAVGATAL